MSDRLAILACGGQLPVMLASAHPKALCFGLKGIGHELGDSVSLHQIEKLGGLFSDMKVQGVGRLVLAGHMSRPALQPAEMDTTTLALMPRLMQALQGGDDALLRTVIAIFEEQGFDVVGAHELLPELTAAPDMAVGTLSAQDKQDVERACNILKALSPLDVGQSCVVAGGQALGIETVQGTDALLRFVADTSDRLRNGGKGVFVKTAKQGQDLRVDMPAIGPETVERVAAAGLAGLVIETGKVMILDRDDTLQVIEKEGLFLMACDI